MSPFEELTELRSVMTVQEISEVTGIRRETLSRARADIRFQRRTQQAIDDLYTVVARLGPILGTNSVHLAAIMRRPQPTLDRRSIAELLQEGRVDDVLEHLGPPESTEEEHLENIQFDAEHLAELEPSPKQDDLRVRAKLAEDERRIAALLDSDPELASTLPAIEAKVHEVFGSGTEIRRELVTLHDSPDAEERLFLRVKSGLSFDQELDRLGKLLAAEEEILGPLRDRLTVGIL